MHTVDICHDICFKPPPPHPPKKTWYVHTYFKARQELNLEAKIFVSKDYIYDILSLFFERERILRKNPNTNYVALKNHTQRITSLYSYTVYII